MLRWESVRQCVCVLSVAWWGVALLRHAARKVIEATEARLDATITLLHETQQLTHEAAQLTQGPLAWMQKLASYLPFPFSLGVPALVHHSRECPNPQATLCASFLLLLAHKDVLREYKECLQQYLKEGRQLRSDFIWRVAFVVGGALLTAAVWEFLEVLKATSRFRVESAASQGESRDLLFGQTQKRKPPLTPRDKKGCSLPPSSLSVLSLHPSHFLNSAPALPTLPSFLSGKSSTVKPSASSIVPLSSSTAASYDQTPQSRKTSILSLVLTGVRRAKMQLFNAILRAAWELFIRAY